MTLEDWQQLVRLLQSLGLRVVKIDTQSGLITLQVPPERE